MTYNSEQRETVPDGGLSAEKAVLGAALVKSSTLLDFVGLLSPDDFQSLNHKVLFETLRDLFRTNTPVDFLTVADALDRKNLLDRLGGKSYLIDLASEVSTTTNIKYYAQMVKDYATRRRIAAAAQSVMEQAANPAQSLSTVMRNAEKLISDAGSNSSGEDFSRLRDTLPTAISSLQKLADSDIAPNTGYKSGFVDLDRDIGGFQPGSLNIIAARPSMGKTALALNIAQFGGSDPAAPVLIFSLEMPVDHLVQRMIAAQAEINISKLRTGTFSTDDFAKIKAACNDLAKREIYINDATQLSALDFRSRCRKFKLRHPDLALVIVDYLQLMTSGEERYGNSRQLEVADISRTIKATAREMNCPIIALSQLSRAAEQRTDKKPQLADLRDSGAIEQDADVVIMIFRQDYYSDNENNDLKDSEADIRIAKNRNGSTGTTKLIFKREITRFCNYGKS